MSFSICLLRDLCETLSQTPFASLSKYPRYGNGNTYWNGPIIGSVYCSYNTVPLISFKTYHRGYDKANTTGAVNGSELLTFPDHLTLPAVFTGDCFVQSFSKLFCVVFCGQLFIYSIFFFWPIHRLVCLSKTSSASPFGICIAFSAVPHFRICFTYSGHIYFLLCHCAV